MEESIYEIKWQKAFQLFVKQNNSFVSQAGTSVNILSLGNHNCFEGPDFRDACLQINGQLFVGDVEFHKKSSDWIAHNHQYDSNYSNVLLHVVFEDNKKINADFETIIVSKSKLHNYLSNPKVASSLAFTITNEDYKYYAMLRLLRRTEEIFNCLKHSSVKSTFSTLLENFLVKYNSFKIRPNSIADFHKVAAALQNTALPQWLCSINKSRKDITELFDSFINSTSNIHINKHLKQEILTNVILPLGFCLASVYAKTELLLWYWSAKTRSKYGILSRIYPSLEQKYIWQQQGMLEHYKEYYKLQLSDSMDFLKDFNVCDYIAYFELTKQPYKI